MIGKFLLVVLFSLGLKNALGNELKALYNSLDLYSVSQALAFYELYSQTAEGDSAKQRVIGLLHFTSEDLLAYLPSLVNRDKGKILKEEEITFIEQLAAQLPNKQLKGYAACSEAEMLALPSEQIDLGRALLLSQFDGKEEALFQARSYSALLDLMVLQMLARLPPGASNEEKIHEMNRFIFEEMHFRFPPHSLYAQEIDLYTFLPSVMDNHLGVCLGVTALYLALAQRMGLPLEIVTPPGHIFVRYREGEKIINIETTARGIDIPTETYLSVNTKSLQQRTLKEVIGMTHVNQASVFLQAGQYERAVASYEKALPYMREDPLVCELTGYSYVLTDQDEKGHALLKKACTLSAEGELVKCPLAKDYLEGNVNKEGIRAIFSGVDETKDSIVAKQLHLLKVLEKYPHFREGLNQLAVCWIQLKRAKEALVVLEKYHTLDPQHPVIEYYLAVLHAERHDYKKAWHYLKNAESIVKEHHFAPKALKELRQELSHLCPDHYRQS